MFDLSKHYIDIQVNITSTKVDCKIIQYFHQYFKSFKTFTGFVDNIFGWKSKALSEESSTTSATLENSFAPKLIVTFIIPK